MANFTLNSGAKPIVQFQDMPANISVLGTELSTNAKQSCANSTAQKGFTNNATIFASYIANVTLFLNNTFNTNGWYIEIGNENNVNFFNDTVF